jgi:ribonucleoside-diphosphate reductase alpha chain
MKIKKRDNRLEQLSIDKIIYRLKKLKNDVSLGKLTTIDTDPIALKIVSSIYDGVSSSELDEETARISISMTENLEYAKLASRIIISNLHKNTSECFSDNMEKLYNNIDSNGNHSPILSDSGIEFIRQHKDILNETCDYTRDYIFDYFGFKTLEKSYLMKLNGKVIERPQHLYMRVAIQVNLGDIDNVIKTYNIISQHLLTFASPTLFNSLGRLGNLSSCFHEDTIVATTNRGPIKIKDVQIGDSVITHLGNVKKVLQLHKNLLNDRKLYNIEIAKTAPIKVTDNHKVWTISPKKVIKDKKQRVCYDLEFVKNFLNENGAKLLSTEYKNMKTKLQIECICKNIVNVSFESIYYKNVLCNNRECIYNRNKFKSKNLTEPHWKSIEDLQNGDYIGIPNKLQESDNIKILDTLLFTKLLENKEPKITFENTDTYITFKTHWEHNNWDKLNGESIKCSKEHSSINRFWNINNDFAKFIGIFYGDGHIMTSNKNIIRGIGITIHDINSNLIDFCKTVGKNIFGIEPTIHIVKNQNIIQVLYNSTFVGEIFKECFGKGFNGKFIWNEMYSWNKSMVLSLLEGLVTTDGCVSKNDCMSLQMSNVKFMRQMYYLLRNNNIDTSYGKENRAKKGTENHIQINIPISEITKQNINKYYSDDRMETDLIKKCRNQYSPIEVNGFKFLKFEKKTQITKNLPEYVYTLGVEDDHSYNVGGIVAENCFLIGTNDSVDGIFKTMSDIAQISKVGGGIGLHIDNIRSKGSVIRGTNGNSDGIIPMLKVYNEISLYINQSGKRKGSFAIYLSPSHPDILEFLDLRKNQGSESLRARDLFYAMWIPDLFMEQLKIDGDWYLMDPDECPGLNETYGEDYEKLYWKYVEEKKYRKQIKAQEIWVKILESQIETGNPYILYKDQINKKSNQKNIGVIKSSNLCCEVTLFSDDKQYAVCNLLSVALPKFIKLDKNNKKYFDKQSLFDIVKYIVLPMNNVIDFNYYPVPETKLSNLLHRPVGLGVQGFSSVLTELHIPFESEEADKLNKEIWETMYFASLTGSMELAKKDGPYSTFKGSPLSEGKFQFDLWAEYNNIEPSLSGDWDWETLRQDIITHGVRNSTLLCQMPTASSAQIMNNTESVECFDSCIYKRRVLSGEYVVCNKSLVRDLTELNLWNKELKDLIIANNGSVQNIDIIPQNIKDIYKTVWEISMKSVINQAASRGAFICQTQSMNLFVSAPTIKKLSSMHMYAYSKHLKTGMYYLRSKSAANSAKFSIDPKLKEKKTKKSAKKQEPSAQEILMCSINNREACDLCTS